MPRFPSVFTAPIPRGPSRLRLYVYVRVIRGESPAVTILPRDEGGVMESSAIGKCSRLGGPAKPRLGSRISVSRLKSTTFFLKEKKEKKQQKNRTTKTHLVLGTANERFLQQRYYFSDEYLTSYIVDGANQSNSFRTSVSRV